MKPVPFGHFGLEQTLMKLHLAQRQLEQPQEPLGVTWGVTTKPQPLTPGPLICNPAYASSKVSVGSGKMFARVVYSVL